MSILVLCAVCQDHATHSGLCCRHRYDEQEPCPDCPSDEGGNPA